MHSAAFRWVLQQVREHEPFHRVLEVGSRNVNGTVRVLFPDDVAYTGIDIRPGTDVDVVANGDSYQPKNDPDCVVCCETLEHAETATEIVENCCRVLTPGGVLIITCAGPNRESHSAVDGGVALRPGEHYRNIDPAVLYQQLKNSGMTSIKVLHDSALGDVYAVARKL